jgi:hypothetical protein
MLIPSFLWNCTEVKDWSDPKDDVPPGAVTIVGVDNINGGAVIRYALPADPDLLGAKAVYSFAESEETMEVFSTTDSIVLEGYADTLEHTVLLYAVDKSGNLSQSTPAIIHPKTPPVEIVRKTLTLYAVFGGVRAVWENPLKKPIAISLYTVDSIGNRELYERHYSSIEQGGYTFRELPDTEQSFQLEVRDRWEHFAAPLDTVLTPLTETEILGKVDNVLVWKLYDEPNAVYRGDILNSNAANTASRNNLAILCDGITWSDASGGYWYYRYYQEKYYIPSLPASNVYLYPCYFTIDMGVPAKYSRFAYWSRPRNPVYSAWVWYELELWGTNSAPKNYSEIGDGSREDNLKYWTEWSVAEGTDAWKNDWKKLADCEIIFPSGTPNTSTGVTSAEDVAFVQGGFHFDVDPDMTGKPFRYLRFVLKKQNIPEPYIQWCELSFWGSYAE